MSLLITKYGTMLTESELEYRKQLIGESGNVCCPVSHEILSTYEGEILFIKGKDKFISTKGIKILEDVFGVEYIEGKVISYD